MYEEIEQDQKTLNIQEEIMNYLKISKLKRKHKKN